MAILLVLVTTAAYWPLISHGFVNYDDPAYVTENAHVQGGLSWQGLRWAFSRLHGKETYWHPLTWVSHMLDCQLFALNPAGHHLVNLLLHSLNTLLVFLVFHRMTGAFWRCALLAALFALHPLQVDTVAWVAERKNVLSTLFWLLTMWAWVGYVERAKGRRPKARGGGRGSAEDTGEHATRTARDARNHRLPFRRFYLLSLLFFALGLMCKPSLVTLPFVLLLLDYWPWGRIELGRSALTALPRLVWEKLPFFALAAVSSMITVLAHRSLGALEPASWLPLDLRLQNAVISYVRYLGKAIWPAHLAVYYPYPAGWPALQVVLSALLLLLVSGLVVRAARTCPYLFVGWFWFLGVLVPFIGLIQAGTQAMADRFAYVPLIGLFILFIWGAHHLVLRRRHGVAVGSAGAAVVLLLCLGVTRQQLAHWKDSEALFRHALAVTPNNCFAQNDLGDALYQKGQISEAIRHYREAIRLKPDHANAYNNLGNALLVEGQPDAAIADYQEAIRLQPDHAKAHNNLGSALFNEGRMDDAIAEYQQAIHLEPDYAQAHYNLGNAFWQRGRVNEAIGQFQEAVRLRPDYADARNNLNAALAARADSAKPQPRSANP